MKRIAFFLLIAGFLVLSSCHLDTAHAPKMQKLFIASDYLTAKDASLFSSFEKETGINVFILHASADSISKKLKKESYSTDIDVVMLASALDVCDYSKTKLLQPILAVEDQPNISFRLRAADFQWVGIAIDPYILVQAKDSMRHKSTYIEALTKENWTTNLKSNKDLYPLMAGLAHRVREEDSLKDVLFSQILERETYFSRPSDSIRSFTTLMTTYSSFYSDSLLYKSGYRNGKIVFPNQTQGGLQFNLRTIAIVKQAKNYSNALKFLHFCTEEKNNERMNNWWNTFPVNANMNKIFSYQRKYFRRYPVEFSILNKYEGRVAKELEQKRKK